MAVVGDRLRVLAEQAADVVAAWPDHDLVGGGVEADGESLIADGAAELPHDVDGLRAAQGLVDEALLVRVGVEGDAPLLAEHGRVAFGPVEPDPAEVAFHGPSLVVVLDQLDADPGEAVALLSVSVSVRGPAQFLLPGARGVQEDAAFHPRGQVFGRSQRDVAYRLGLLDLQVDAELRAVVRAGPDRHRAVAAEQRVRGISVAQRDKVRFKGPLRRLVRRQAFVSARRDGLVGQYAEADAARLQAAGPDGRLPRVRAAEPRVEDRVGRQSDGPRLDLADHRAALDVEVGAGRRQVRAGVRHVARRGGVDDAAADQRAAA